ncbi:MAG TPA: DUF938 domain-containing protein [Polyangiaceae bacterium]
MDFSLPTWPAPERNKAPILQVLTELFHRGLVLEIAAGTGQHAVHFAAGLPEVTWQPSEKDPELLDVLSARVTQARLPNLKAPVALDAASATWPVNAAEGVFCANLLHISEWSVAEGLFSGAQRVLSPGALLITYGPYRSSGVHTSASNADFDASLRAQNPTWGVRDIDDLSACARERGFRLADTLRMPANNFTLVWQRL